MNSWVPFDITVRIYNMGDVVARGARPRRVIRMINRIKARRIVDLLTRPPRVVGSQDVSCTKDSLTLHTTESVLGTDPGSTRVACSKWPAHDRNTDIREHVIQSFLSRHTSEGGRQITT